MNYFYFDTCAIVRIFIETEAGHGTANEIYNGDNQIITNELSNLEFVSALTRQLNNRQITQQQFDDARRLFARKFTDSVDTGKVLFLNVDSEIYAKAVDLIIEHKLRSLDAIQLQTILPYVDLNPVFVTSDNKLASAASHYFSVYNLNEM